MARNEGTLGHKRKELEGLETQVREAKQKIKDDEERIFNQTAVQVSLRNAMTDVIKELQGTIARKRRLEFENEKVYSEKNDTTQKSKQVRQKIDDLLQEISGLQERLSEKDQMLLRIKQKMEELDFTISDLEKKKVFCISQKEFIEKLNTQYQDMPDPTIEGRFITQTSPEEHHTGIIGKVRSVQPLSPERLSFLSQNFTNNPEDKLYEIVCETKFIELDPKQIALKIDEISAAINGVVLQKNALQETCDEQKQIRRQMKDESQQKERSCSILQAQEKDIQKVIDKLISEIEIIDVELVELKELLSSLRKKESELSSKLETVTQDIHWCQKDIKEQQDWISTKSQEKEEAKILIAQLETEIEADKAQLENHRENEKLFKATLDSNLDEIKMIGNELETNKQRHETYEREINEFSNKIISIKAEKEKIQQNLKQHLEQKQQLSKQISHLKNNKAGIEDSLQSLIQEQHEHKLKLQEISFNEKGIKDRLWQKYQLNYNAVFGLEEESAPPDEAGEHALSSAETTEESSAAGSPEEGESPTPPAKTPLLDIKDLHIPEDVRWEEQYEEMLKLRKHCESFGSVNLVAIEEYEELKERFEFLTQQECDLIESRMNLMNTIKKINRSTRQMFLETFTKVSEEFRIYFRMLFGGGEAELVLIDPENVLESGIDIVARPPGKKLQNINLLSGGEKSLTAIALIFGVFKVNPSPFCILDEIDAALDESNVDRFSYLLKEFAQIAQFIVITHNKKTITAADAMYGITMPETGISRIVSVKFSEKEDAAQVKIPVPA